MLTTTIMVSAAVMVSIVRVIVVITDQEGEMKTDTKEIKSTSIKKQTETVVINTVVTIEAGARVDPGVITENLQKRMEREYLNGGMRSVLRQIGKMETTMIEITEMTLEIVVTAVAEGDDVAADDLGEGMERMTVGIQMIEVLVMEETQMYGQEMDNPRLE